VQSWASSFQNCCYLIIDLGSRLFDESWPDLGAVHLNSAVELGSRTQFYARCLPFTVLFFFHKPVSFPLRLERVNRWSVRTVGDRLLIPSGKYLTGKVGNRT